MDFLPGNDFVFQKNIGMKSALFTAKILSGTFVSFDVGENKHIPVVGAVDVPELSVALFNGKVADLNYLKKGYFTTYNAGESILLSAKIFGEGVSTVPMTGTWFVISGNSKIPLGGNIYRIPLVRDEVESRATEALLQVTEDAKVYLSHFSFAEEEYTEVEQLDEYLQTEDGQYAFGMLIYIADHVDSELSDQQIVSNVEKSLIAAGVGYPTVRVFFINNMELYDSLNRESQEQLIFRSGKEKNYRCDYTISLAKLE